MRRRDGQIRTGVEEVADAKGKEVSDAVFTPWPHQLFGVSEVLAARERGERKICLTTPTGGGKSWQICKLIDFCIDNMLRAVVYTNRRILTTQMKKVMEAHDIKHGIRAADHEDQRHLAIQISSLPTEYSRVLNRKQWELHDADFVIVDEAHCNAGPKAKEIIQAHYDAGATIVGPTATPIDLAHIYDTLIVAGKNSELRACGALVPCRHFGCDEPDLRHIGPVKIGEDLTESQNVKAIMAPGVFGRVSDWWNKLNPDARPAIGFAPNVDGGIFFCEEFSKIGVPCAEIDGKECWLDGKRYQTSEALREDIAGKSKDGRVKIVWNRFVLREGVNWPWLYHGILATVFGKLGSLLQSVGRLLRSYPGIDEVMLGDHGGNWHHHGSVNADREWYLGETSSQIAAKRDEALRNKTELEPIRCPKCGEIRKSGPKCMKCGFQCDRKVRPVIQHDGSLVEYEGDIYKPRVTQQKPDSHKKWEGVFWRCRKSGKTFRQARGLFFHEHGYWPSQDMPYMPTQEGDWSRKVAEVPFNRLIMPERMMSKQEKSEMSDELFEGMAS